MALIDCHFHSDVLGLATSMKVILPQQTKTQIGMESSASENKHPTLYLLHGMSDDDSIWLRRTSIERYVAKMGLAVVMPQVHRSYYTDMESGGRYWTFISEELPRISRSFFPLSEKREHNFVAGLSMGGYGAFKLAMTFPDRFAAGASLSGAMDAARLQERRSHEYKIIFGDKSIKGTKSDLFHLAEELLRSPLPKPSLYQCCGTEDILYEDNVRFRDHCRNLGLPVTYEEEPGQHEWGYWDMKIQNVLKWLPL